MVKLIIALALPAYYTAARVNYSEIRAEAVFSSHNCTLQAGRSDILLNVKDYGAKGDGRADDTSAIEAAQLALPDGGGTLFFPAGTYLVSRNGIVIKKSNLTFKGSGMFSSTLKRATKAGPIAQSSAAYPGIINVAFEDLGFDGNYSDLEGTWPSIGLYGTSIHGRTRVSRCRLWRSSSFGILLIGMQNVSIEDSIFHSPGEAQGGGIAINENSQDIFINRNRFLYLQNGIVITTRDAKNQAAYSPHSIFITNSYFDSGWWLLKEKFSGEGSSVSYMNTQLRDANASFSGLSAARNTYWHNVRVMPVKQTGNGTFSTTAITDAKARFLTGKVRRGDIVRAGKGFAVIARIASETSLEIEEWLTDSDRQPLKPPDDGTPYTVYGIYLGGVWNQKGEAYTATSITSQTGWWDLDGRRVVPPNGSRYEVLARRPNYPIFIDEGTHNIKIQDNTLKRGWSDQISIFAGKARPTNAVITGNMIEDGEDMGITLHGVNNYVADNTIRHQGCGGIWTDADDSLIKNNRVFDSQWTNDTALGCGDIILTMSNRTTVSNNYCERVSSLGRWGILVWNETPTSTDGNVIIGNESRNHPGADIGLITSLKGSVTHTTVKDNRGTMVIKGASYTVTK